MAANSGHGQRTGQSSDRKLSDKCWCSAKKCYHVIILKSEHLYLANHQLYLCSSICTMFRFFLCRFLSLGDRNAGHWPRAGGATLWKLASASAMRRCSIGKCPLAEYQNGVGEKTSASEKKWLFKKNIPRLRREGPMKWFNAFLQCSGVGQSPELSVGKGRIGRLGTMMGDRQ